MNSWLIERRSLVPCAIAPRRHGKLPSLLVGEGPLLSPHGEAFYGPCGVSAWAGSQLSTPCLYPMQSTPVTIRERNA